MEEVAFRLHRARCPNDGITVLERSFDVVGQFRKQFLGCCVPVICYFHTQLHFVQFPLCELKTRLQFADGRKISRKLKRKVLDSSVVPAITYGLETLDLSELHQHKLEVCENNWIRRIVGVRRVERRRMKDLREEVGTKACIVRKIVKSRMKWVGLGHMVRMKDEN